MQPVAEALRDISEADPFTPSTDLASLVKDRVFDGQHNKLTRTVPNFLVTLVPTPWP
jgi:hypothetical protein